MESITRVKELVTVLNKARNTYYNESNPTMIDKEYDLLFDELSLLEKQTGFILNNSPTQTVGYEIKSELSKVTHSHPMLSLDKTKSVEDIKKFLNGQAGIAMLKVDGLTSSNEYINSKLNSSETRGNGEVGEDITHNAKVISNLPSTINIQNKIVIDGEVIIDWKTFNNINAKLNEEGKEPYSTPRNLASGSIRQLDSKIAANRNIKFIAWKAVEGIESNSFYERLNKLSELGFEVVPYRLVDSDAKTDNIQNVIEELKAQAMELDIPIDGIVFGYDDIKYGESLGATGHHLKSQMAFKFTDEEVETVITDIEYNPSRYGVLTPVAIFEPVELDGTEVSRASLHNISIMEDLQISVGDTATVYKANCIIPQLADNLTRKGNVHIPEKCPICGHKTTLKQENGTKVLHCDNLSCKSRIVAKLSHFVSKNAMNIDGFSESTIEKFVELGWLNEIKDIYYLHLHKEEMRTIQGFGDKSVNKLLIAIENGRQFKLENLLYSLGIQLIGRTASKDISKFCDGCVTMFMDSMNLKYDFTKVIDGFGDAMLNSLYSWWNENDEKFTELLRELKPIGVSKKNTASERKLDGLTFVITGSVYKFKNRDELKERIEELGGKVAGSVSKNSNYLINNDSLSQSGKNKKANELGIKIITEDEFLEMVK